MTLSLFERSYRWLESAVKSSVSNGKVWLESYVIAWFFFHNHLNLLHHDDVLIVIDKFPETLMAYKAVIERQGAPCNILYIADSSDTPPLRRGIIDCNMDFFASNEHNFYHPGMYLKQLLPYLKPQCELFGVYFFFKNGHKSIRKCMADYPESFKHNFNVQWFFSEIKQDFHIVDTIDLWFVFRLRQQSWTWVPRPRRRITFASVSRLYKCNPAIGVVIICLSNFRVAISACAGLPTGFFFSPVRISPAKMAACS